MFLKQTCIIALFLFGFVPGQDYYPLAVGNAWNFKVDIYTRPDTNTIFNTYYHTEFFVKDTSIDENSEEINLFAYAKKADSLAFNVIDSSYDWSNPDCFIKEVGDTIWVNIYGHPMLFHNPTEGLHITSKDSSYRCTILNTTIDTVMVFVDTTFIEYLGDFETNGNVFHDCYKYFNTIKIFDHNGILPSNPLIHLDAVESFEIVVAPDIGIVYIKRKILPSGGILKAYLNGYAINGVETWLNSHIYFANKIASKQQLTVHPNPFTDAVTFNLHGIIIKNIRILNTQGRVIKNLVENKWDGTDNNGFKVSPGQYILEIRHDKTIEVQRLIRMR